MRRARRRAPRQVSVSRLTGQHRTRSSGGSAERLPGPDATFGVTMRVASSIAVSVPRIGSLSEFTNADLALFMVARRMKRCLPFRESPSEVGAKRLVARETDAGVHGASEFMLAGKSKCPTGRPHRSGVRDMLLVSRTSSPSILGCTLDFKSGSEVSPSDRQRDSHRHTPGDRHGRTETNCDLAGCDTGGARSPKPYRAKWT